MPEQKGGFPSQQQGQPGRESQMNPQPKTGYRHTGSARMRDKIVLLTGGDSGIGKAAALAFAEEGAHLAIVYYNEHEDAKEVERLVKEKDRNCILLAGDVGDEKFCQQAVKKTIETYGRLDVLVNNAGKQVVQQSIESISNDQLENTFRTNVFSMFYLTKAALPHLKEGSSIINTTSVTAYKGHPLLLDYSATKGAIVSFTRALANSLASKGIRVNGVAPGPIWTPLIPSSFPPEMVEKFGKQVPMGRAGQPEEVAPCYVFLASDDASYMTGQILHPNGGEAVES